MRWDELKAGDVLVNKPELDGAPVTVLVLERAGDTLAWLNLANGMTHETTRRAWFKVKGYALLARAGG